MLFGAGPSSVLSSFMSARHSIAELQQFVVHGETLTLRRLLGHASQLKANIVYRSCILKVLTIFQAMFEAAVLIQAGAGPHNKKHAFPAATRGQYGCLLTLICRCVQGRTLIQRAKFLENQPMQSRVMATSCVTANDRFSPGRCGHTLQRKLKLLITFDHHLV